MPKTSMAVTSNGKIKPTRKSESPTGTFLEPLEKALYLELKKYSKLIAGQNVLIAVSGGIDSVVLLHALAKIQDRLKIKVHVVHINHGVRAQEADTDEEFVTEISKKLGVPVTSFKIKLQNQKASENNLREKRYKILFEEKKRLKAPVIVTAHHRDDLLETRLMRLLQGTGIHGLKAMTPLSEEGILRPLLELTRRDVETYAKKLNLRWRNDATNSDTTKFRNWIRRNWIARLKMDHPGYVDNLFESLERLVRQNDSREEKTSEKDWSVFNRALLDDSPAVQLNSDIYNFLRHNSKERITSNHVAEFKKRLQTNRKKFEFRLAGMDWVVDESCVTPTN